MSGTRRQELRLTLVSFLVLYLELALIRFLSGHVLNFGYFSSFVLMAAFLGIGLGCLLYRQPPLVPKVPLLLLLLAGIVTGLHLEVVIPSSASSVFWAESVRLQAVPVPAAALIPFLFVFMCVLFIGPGQVMGELFAALPRLRAYALNIVGSLVGILAFALGSALGHPPAVWFAVIGAALAGVGGTQGKAWRAAGIVATAATIALAAWAGRGDTWGPYYRQSVMAWPDGTHALLGNGVPGIHVAPARSNPGRFLYDSPYEPPLRPAGEAPPARVLIIGCGAGNDVAAALQHGVGRVDAVDINPWVIEVGRALHPDRPFASPQVQVVVADGRTFLRHARESYDLVVYGLPDSTFTHDRSNLRVESFLFTLEAFREVRARLTPRGVFVIYNYYRVPWLVERLRGTLRHAFGTEPVLLRFDEGLGWPAVLAVGPGVPGQPPLPPVWPSTPRPATDDWPFLYLLEPRVPTAYLGALALVGVACAALVAAALRASRGSGPTPAEGAGRAHYAALFLMGAAFILLETRSLATFGLYFGTTWWTSVVVFAAIHCSILLAVLATARLPQLPAAVPFAALFGSLWLTWAVPQDALLDAQAGWRGLLVPALAFLPIFCANVLFSRLFRDTPEGERGLAWNLLGGMVGGLAEYGSLVVGFRALLPVAALLYLGALACAWGSSPRSGHGRPVLE